MRRNKPVKVNEKLSEFMPANYPVTLNYTELFGVEIELEGKGGISLMTNELYEYWSPHNDGSLRKLKPGDEAIEYVFKEPLTYEHTAKAIKMMTTFLTRPQVVVYDSYRTSIHVHVNCMSDTLLHVYNFITLAILFDELFVSQNGDHRIGNNFCLRARDAEGQVEDLINSIQKTGAVFSVDAHHRYSSVNFASLAKFGTVEFRSLECTTDPIRIMHWINTINSLKKASRTFENPQEIVRKFSQMDINEFMYQTLGVSAPKYMAVPGYQHMLFDGMRLAQDFAFCSDWVSKPQEKPSTMDDYIKFVKAQQAMQINMIPPPAPPDNPQWVAHQWDMEAQPVPGEQPMHVAEDDDDDEEDDIFQAFEDEDEDFE